MSWYKTSLFQELKQAKEILEKPPVLYPGAFSAHCNSLGRAEPQFPKTSHNIETSLHGHEFKTRAKNSDFSHNCQGFTNVFILKAESDFKSRDNGKTGEVQWPGAGDVCSVIFLGGDASNVIYIKEFLTNFCLQATEKHDSSILTQLSRFTLVFILKAETTENWSSQQCNGLGWGMQAE